MPAKPTPIKSGPTITDEHLKKYEAIMKIPVKSDAPTNGMSSVSKLLTSIPKAKGIGNKIFIFTGNKKIIMDGTEREEEKIKTVDAGKNAPLPQPKIDIVKVNSAPVKTADVPLVVVGKKEETHENKKTEKPKGEPKKIPRPVLFLGFIIFVATWTLMWAYIFGYFKL